MKNWLHYKVISLYMNEGDNTCKWLYMIITDRSESIDVLCKLILIAFRWHDKQHCFDVVYVCFHAISNWTCQGQGLLRSYSICIP